MDKPPTEHELALESKQLNSSRRTATELLRSAAPHQRAVLRILATASEHSIDPAPLLSGLADELSGRYGRSLKTVAARVAAGEDPIEAAIQAPGLFTNSTLLALRLAQEEGTLKSLIAGLEGKGARNQEIDSPADSPVKVVFRLGIRIFFMVWILAFMAMFILPEFELMFEEFGVELPATMKLLIVYSHRFASYWYFLPIVMLIALPFCVPSLLNFFKKWSPLTWRQPTFHRSADRRRELALIAQAKQPFPAGVKILTALRPSRWSGGRFRRASKKVDSGQDLWSTLASERIISPRDARALSISADQETQAWLLRASAHRSQKRSETRFEVVFRLVVAVIHILLGLIVVFVCVSVFMTLATLMNSIFSSPIN